jgi:hypothetical protein
LFCFVAQNSHKADYDCVAPARAALGEEAFAAAWAERRAMALDQGVEYALEGDEQV